eukprot:2828118-Amphidinium_carterae.1
MQVVTQETAEDEYGQDGVLPVEVGNALLLRRVCRLALGLSADEVGRNGSVAEPSGQTAGVNIGHVAGGVPVAVVSVVNRRVKLNAVLDQMDHTEVAVLPEDRLNAM